MLHAPWFTYLQSFLDALDTVHLVKTSILSAMGTMPYHPAPSILPVCPGTTVYLLEPSILRGCPSHILASQTCHLTWIPRTPGFIFSNLSSYQHAGQVELNLCVLHGVKGN